MYETEDLILRKNEKNFILCLLEVARFGSKFGIEVPTIIQLEQEIEAEIERERQFEKEELTSAVDMSSILTSLMHNQPEVKQKFIVFFYFFLKKSTKKILTIYQL